MDTEDCINRQRVQHIVDSYRLEGNDGELFGGRLAHLLETYPQPLVELALTESIIKGWSEIPMPRGMRFIQRVHARLCYWKPGLESSHQVSRSYPNVCGATSVDVAVEAVMKIAQTTATQVESINTLLTPGQFEHITGLDSSFVFDGAGKVRLM